MQEAMWTELMRMVLSFETLGHLVWNRFTDLSEERATAIFF
jgi:hypothetical protein